MKTMTCKQLGGACNHEFRAGSFEEMAEISKQHAMEMFRQGDQDHIQAMQYMQQRMQSPQAMQEWMDEKRREFDALPNE